jgi:hypothetical protein
LLRTKHHHAAISPQANRHRDGRAKAFLADQPEAGRVQLVLVHRNFPSIRSQEGLTDSALGVIEDHGVPHDEKASDDPVHPLGYGGRRGKMVHAPFRQRIDRHDRAIRAHEDQRHEVVGNGALRDLRDLVEDLANVHRFRQRGEERLQRIEALAAPVFLFPDPLVLERRSDHVGEREDHHFVLGGECIRFS